MDILLLLELRFGDVGQQCHWVCNVVGSSVQDAREVTFAMLGNKEWVAEVLAAGLRQPSGGLN